MGLRIVCISDTHERDYSVPDGDVLIHSGDLTFHGGVEELHIELDRLNSFPHKHKILVSGNHDWGFQNQYHKVALFLGPITYLENEGLIIDNLTFWGSPWQPAFCNWAFNLPRGGPLRRIWAKMPDKLDVLITHSPPGGILDLVPGAGHVGCMDLRERVDKVKPKLHIFGHIHCAYGQYKTKDTHFINASVCNEKYQPVNLPIVVDL